MKVKSYEQFAIVVGDSAQTLTEELNRKLVELADKKPTVSFEGLIARISYTETETEPENVVEDYRFRGVDLTCLDCPFFDQMRTADGSVDRRAKWGNCRSIEDDNILTHRDSPACELLFKKLNDGEVRLCIATE